MAHKTLEQLIEAMEDWGRGIEGPSENPLLDNEEMIDRIGSDEPDELSECPECKAQSFQEDIMTCSSCGHVEDQLEDIDPDADDVDLEDWGGLPTSYELSAEAKLYEKLTMKGRMALSRAAHKRKSKLTLGRKKAKRKTAQYKDLYGRASRRARRMMANQLAGGVFKRDHASHAGLNRMQTMINSRSGQLDMLRRKLLSKTRKDDRKKTKKRKGKK